MRRLASLATIALTASIAASILAAPAAAQRTSREGRGSAGVAAAPDSPNPVKRTWDFTKRFGIPRFDSADCASDPARLAEFLDAYNANVDRFLAGPTDPKKLGLERRNYVKQVLGTARDIGAYLGAFETSGQRSPDSYVPPVEDDICRAQAQKHALLALRAGLAAIARVYPDMVEVAPALAEADAALARVGDDAAIRKLVTANRAASLAAVRMKPALAKNPAWENGLRDGFSRLVPDETILRLHLYSSDWYIHRNEFTSVPEYRQIGAWVATRRSDGTCWINGIDLWQNFTGTGFDSGEYKLGQAPQQILCENLPK
ncbi:hypothetical protein [Porphyrobacter sp. ULC335]|uniref:hypothetical protein n=1 Tax=Porphyrobacter sp. ULC335 TaxID=2854260 RepID=UPI0022209182|nr:hypothetical protein [Porphyrobacter sp. ULC335]UYV17092.1 hypothetical protein KVF90_07310 [Porphyrobacter sp. ULC335]